MGLPQLSKRAAEPGEPVPPEAFWAVSPGINWSWYALLQPEDEGFRILKYDRIHHGDPGPRTGTGVTLIEDKGRTVTGVRLSGEHSTGIKTVPVTNPKHVFGYPPITFEDEQSFAKAREKEEPPVKRDEASAIPPLSKRAAGRPRSVGERITLRGHGKIQFEVVGVATHGEETYYRVKPVDTVYGVPEDMVEEERHSEKVKLEGARSPLSKRADLRDHLAELARLAQEESDLVERAKQAVKAVEEEMRGDMPLDRGALAALERAAWMLHKAFDLSSEHVFGNFHSRLQERGWKLEEGTKEVSDRRRWEKLQTLAHRLMRKMEPLAKGQGPFDHPNRELTILREQVERGFQPRLVHQLETAIMRAYWQLKGIPEEEGWKRSREGREKEEQRRRIREMKGE